MLGRVDVSRALLVAGADANSIDHNSFSPLYLASQNGHAQLVLDLLSAGADAGIKTSRVSYPLEALEIVLSCIVEREGFISLDGGLAGARLMNICPSAQPPSHVYLVGC